MAKAADVKKAYTVAVILLVVGGVWTMMAGDGINPVPLGLFLAGVVGVAAAAFTSIRAKRRAEKVG